MKKIIFSLLTLGLAGLLVSAVAQNAPDENNNTNAPAAPDHALAEATYRHQHFLR